MRVLSGQGGGRGCIQISYPKPSHLPVNAVMGEEMGGGVRVARLLLLSYIRISTLPGSLSGIQCVHSTTLLLGPVPSPPTGRSLPVWVIPYNTAVRFL